MKNKKKISKNKQKYYIDLLKKYGSADPEISEKARKEVVELCKQTFEEVFGESTSQSHEAQCSCDFTNHCPVHGSRKIPSSEKDDSVY